jgi:hypothetical protein
MGRTLVRSLFIGLCLSIATLGSASMALAQTGLATITGIVTDNTAGAVPGLTVSATNKETGVAYTGVTSDAGVYTITSVPIGSYVVSAEMQGFKTVQSTISLSAAQTARVDFKLELGTVSETIEVIATGAVLQTENAVVGTKLERDQVEKLPIQGRNAAAASLFSAGAVTPNPQSFTSLKNTTGGRPYVNGQREQTNNFTLDGVDMNDAIDNLVPYQPSPDALEQVSIETNNYSPETGNVGGAIINMVIKSGTNRFSGNAFNYWRDSSMAATPWHINRAGGKKADFTRDIFGGTIGGPIAQNKVFFFADYQGGRQDQPPADAFRTVAPDEFRRGDFSSLLTRSTPIQLRDPLTGQPFVNNQIPISRFSPFARALFANETLYPRANVSRSISDFRQNYVGKTAEKQSTNQFDVKIDWNASARDKMFVRVSKQTHEVNPGATAFPLEFVAASENPFWSVGANWNRIFGTSLVNDLLVGYNNNEFNSALTDLNNVGMLNNQLGIGGSQPIPGLSEVRFAPLTSDITFIGNLGLASNTANKVFQIAERLTWVRSRHTLKFGGTWNYYKMQRYYGGNNGQLGFIGYNSASFTGFPFADFLLDQVSGKGRGSVAEPWTQLQHRVGIYAADDFKLSDNLTLNLGLRWAYTSPLVEIDDRQANFDLTNATQLIAGQNGNSRALYNAYKNGWEPRLGFAYRKGDRWVFRGGYGISQYMEGTGANLRLPLNPPFFFESEARYDTTSGASTIQTGFDGLQALDRPSGQLRAWDPNLRPQFSQQWNFFVEYLVGQKSSINIGYVGSDTDHLVTPVDGNQPLPGTGPTSTWLPIQNRRPLFQFNPLITSISTTAARGRANYHGLQTSFKQRPIQGLEFLANYTWSKTMTNNLGYYGAGAASTGFGAVVNAQSAYPQNSYDIEADYGPAFFDATHVVSLSGSYELPIGKDRKFGSQMNRALDTAIGGWSTSFAVVARSGFPITVTNTGNPSLQASRATERPDRIGSGEVDNPTVDRWIDRAAFVSAPAGEFGDSGVGILRAPGYWNLDISISKRFATFGRQFLLFRGEMFNALNHPNFGPPERNIASTSFGTITNVVGDPRLVQLVVKYSF